MGKEFDALLVTMDTEDSPFEIFETAAYEDSLEVSLKSVVNIQDAM